MSWSRGILVLIGCTVLAIVIIFITIELPAVHAPYNDSNAARHQQTHVDGAKPPAREPLKHGQVE